MKPGEKPILHATAHHPPTSNAENRNPQAPLPPPASNTATT
eukprot:CAMPEP_0171839086 /NCGR_PEP_ID=MMETSP0992-20121227/13145_1 /TAXON_ID=483369 /ORGANISM="non described non described, Strain CCMP2098" /LENGTH=40 /DNA_ID= /DNA_START= /DNA_END= /DNA_ORIENTATION=